MILDIINTAATVVLAGAAGGSAYLCYQSTRAMLAIRSEALALRKQMKAVLRDASRTNADATRLLQKQYRQQEDVNDILYWAKERKGELNG